MTNSYIIAKQDTYLKKTPTKQASELGEGMRHFAKEGSKFKVTGCLKKENNHAMVSLDYAMGAWYIYLPHFKFEGCIFDVAGVKEIEESEEDIKEEDKIAYKLEDIDLAPVAPKTYEDVDWTDMTAKVSKYFTVREVTNNDARRIPKDRTIQNNIFNLSQELDIVRERWGSAILVTSWYRPTEINRAVGGARNSQHLTGNAVDVYPANGNLLSFQKWLDTVAWAGKALGYGAKKGFVHLDSRRGRIRWNY